ncbi:hypothetical protein OCO53_20000 [Peribacillus frigoritolerans]|uniref:hypothetical protein n=1 Tax=Peribacillus frigoritolerans TaxID=450367 RepID=UPI0021CFD063|nr:hypothetical protein [Peribacillus frigoritolerans]MCU6602740.1 hypothetical protein [Peribacillus frigoritolerans]
MKEDNENIHTNNIEQKYVPYTLAAVITSPIIGWILVKEKGYNFSELGTFGDFLGGSTVPLLTFITILLLIRTIRIQNNQLEIQNNQLEIQNNQLVIQKDEYTLLRKEMEDTKKALQEQGKTARMQRYENSFFIQINELRNIKKELEEGEHYSFHPGGKVPYKNVMEHTYKRIREMAFEDMVDYNLIHKLEEKSPAFLHEYGKLYDRAYSHWISDADDFNPFSTYHFIIERIVILIFHYKDVMDKWELKYYKDFLYEEISSEGINMVLLHLIMRSKERLKVKELKLDDYISPYNNPDFNRALFDFLLKGSQEW